MFSLFFSFWSSVHKNIEGFLGSSLQTAQGRNYLINLGIHWSNWKEHCSSECLRYAFGYAQDYSPHSTYCSQAIISVPQEQSSCKLPSVEAIV